MTFLRALFLNTAALFALTSTGWAETISIPGPDGPLEGELITVDSADNIIVVIPGSGPIDRDGNMPAFQSKTNLYKQITEALAAEGIAALRVDKRGFFGSEKAIADPNDVTIAAYAEDMVKWVGRAHQEATCVWLAGHSEGGLVALYAAQSAPEGLCGVILMAAAGRPIGELLIEQMERNPANGAILEDAKAIVTDLEQGQSRPLSDIPPALHGLFNPSLQRYMMDLFSHDPLALAHNWSGPALVLQGDRDIQVQPHDADLLTEALPTATRVDLSGGTHILKQDVAGNPFATYTNPELPLHEDLVPTIVDFLNPQD
ncbi:alpha/beta hydrolase [Shimia sp. MMG029]|uniref:alpha/beta hydrolase n=1 Tax=Shimia sp. MMG029 TaxID=3021978 RepID=UPI0022FF4234|nr:alpha/beta fold hydrolase [Shimia sp. MMG029]MDA5557268.1 alpha/beta fold hydrolase [Shimia sp. MMG029]